MKNLINIGIIIADANEYEPLLEYVERYGGKNSAIHSHTSCEFEISDKERTVRITGILCGVGKVNAAACTAYLIDRGTDYVINAGLSGGISGIGRGEVAVGSSYLEHDFDLSPLGYPAGEKPDGETVHYPDKLLFQHITALYPQIKSGAMVTGDRFVNSDSLRSSLATKYSAMACDMESSAAAAVCAAESIGFIAVRRVSDDAGNSANSDYCAAVGDFEKNLVEIVMTAVAGVLRNDIFWK